MFSWMQEVFILGNVTDFASSFWTREGRAEQTIKMLLVLSQCGNVTLENASNIFFDWKSINSIFLRHENRASTCGLESRPYKIKRVSVAKVPCNRRIIHPEEDLEQFNLLLYSQSVNLFH